MKLDQIALKKLLHYSPSTGDFIIFPRRGTAGSKGSVASNGALVIRINRVLYYAHRLAWLYMTGNWPSGQVDHRDGNPLNNRWSNLRIATQSLNNANAKLRRDSTSGLKGVTFHKRAKKWCAQIQWRGRHIYLGLFQSKTAAHNAYMKKATCLFGEYARCK